MHPRRTSVRLLTGTLLVYALLVATNLGEFWPFSIYPMFSQGGHPWSRALVRDVTHADAPVPWDTLTLADLPGEPFATLDHGIDPIDLANFVSKTKRWDAERLDGLARMFEAEHLDGRRLLVMRAHGRLSDSDTVAVSFVPYVLLQQDSLALNPHLPR